MLYIGEGDPVRPRLESHYAQKDFWTRAVFFVGNQQGTLNKAHVQYLEARLIELAHAAKRMPLDNINKPNRPTLNEADQADMEVFLQNILQMLPLLGISAFEKPSGGTRRNKQRLFITAKGVKAEGYESNEGFVVCKGSQAVKDTVPSMEVHVRSMYEARQNLIDSEVLMPEGDHYVFTQDYSFSSPSTAAGVVLGRSANGRTEWKDGSGRTLKSIQEEKVAEEAVS